MTMAEMMELPCFHWVFLPLAADMTPETLLPHLQTIQSMISSEPDPERKRRLNDVAAGMSVVAHHKKDASIEACIQEFFKEEIMTCEWYRNARAEGREEGVEKGRQALLNTARMILPIEVVNTLALITDIDALEAAVSAEYKAHAH